MRVFHAGSCSLLAICLLGAAITAQAAPLDKPPPVPKHGATARPVEPVNSAPKAKDENNPAFHKALLEIAGQYTRYQLSDERPRPAPERCALSLPQLSQSGDGGSHGKKFYYLYVKDLAPYLKHDKVKPGQAPVKESYKAIPTKTGPSQKVDYTLGDKYGLFIMLKMPPQTVGTDEGWIYGTVTPDGKTVTGSGRMASCMSCHLSAPHGRLFGVKAAR